MKKRSKLDLTAANKGKSQAAGFDTKVSPGHGSESGPEPRKTRSQASAGRQQSRVSTNTSQARAPRGLVFMTVAVVAVAALSFFVLKRR